MPSDDPLPLDRARLRFADLDHVPIGLVVLDPDLRVLFWNATIEDWTGLSRGSALGRSMADLDPEWALPHYAQRLSILFDGGPPVLFSPLLHPRIVPLSAGTGRNFNVKASAVPDGTEGWWAFLSVEDVTVLSRRVEELRALKVQQDRMMREVHHRVKNNLNMISGLITLQKMRAAGDGAGVPLDDLQSRIAAIGEIHDLLYRSSDLSAGNTAAYLETLGRMLDTNLSFSDTHRLEIHLDPTIVLKTDTTVLLGLIQAELMTNALKYGLGKTGAEVLTIRLSRVGPREFLYELSHTGDRLPADFDPATSQGLGMVLLGAYATQLGTTLGWTRGDPTRFWLRFME